MCLALSGFITLGVVRVSDDEPITAAAGAGLGVGGFGAGTGIGGVGLCGRDDGVVGVVAPNFNRSVGLERFVFGAGVIQVRPVQSL
jgi:hypothetical protein